MVDSENHFNDDNLKSIKFRERASAVNKLLNLFGYKHVKETSKIDKYTFLQNWQHVAQARTFTMSEMHKLFDMDKHMRINFVRNARQILLYENTLLKPYEICIRSCRGKTHNIMQSYEFDALIQ